MAEPQAQTFTIVSCTIIAKPESNPRDEMTEFHVAVVAVRAGESGTPFRLRTNRGTPLKPLHFERGTTIAWITDLLMVGAEILVPIAAIASRWQTPADGYMPSDCAVNPKEITPVGRRLTAEAPTTTPTTPHTTPVPGVIQFNNDGKMGERVA